MSYTLGIDYGTNSVRALIVNCQTGEELAAGVVNYPSGQQGILLDAKDAHVARQSPADYLYGLEESVRIALAQANQRDDFDAKDVIGIGVDSTGSSPIPVDASNTPLALDAAWKDHLAAQCWLWKDHTSHAEAKRITELAAAHRPQYIAKCGNIYSSEWWWSKIWHCLNVAPEVFEAAYSWVELCDYVPSVLAGVKDPKQVVRGICAAGHKALYAEDWGGLPDKEFLSLLDPKLADLRDRLYTQAVDISHSAGKLCAEWAEALGLPAGIEIAVGEFDVHFGAIGCGVTEGTLVKVIGTSTCDCGVVSAENTVADIPGICGIVKGAILPGFYGIEAGQSACGDLFKWWVETACQNDESMHRDLTEAVASQRPGQSGLLALDWNNGNRTVLVDQRLTGLILGQTLHTTQAEIYRALIEATAFGARMIIERIEAYGVPIERVVCAGGIAEKNALLMQIYADVTGREMRVSGSSQACALGSAVGAAVLAGAHPDFSSAQAAMTSLKDIVYRPDPAAHATYNQLFKLYQEIHDAFGGVNSNADLGQVMKQLLNIKESI
ncbi:ribulokinase [Coraliomargarita sp. SDUM461004]|uniref:Ribulokinase n=1 Tax=Thalassobacterium sedimentorum TaxID=3041258 RepID=A0ABU1ANN2_9BACT|nr:ribulokinase [Coraliomargarita sp. SDUM461004]MDQ8195813.1 ribulokinase [Coraliomargarita sp. SDUM461004]